MKEKRVLMVDDERGIIDNTLKELKKINFKFSVLFESEINAEKAVSILRQNHTNYNAVLMDVEFKRQKMQGFDAVEEIRSFSNIPIIMISSSKRSCLVGIDLGADSFMSKGIMSKEELEKCKHELEKVLSPDYKRLEIKPASNKKIVEFIKKNFLPLDIDMQALVILVEKKEVERACDYLKEMFNDGVDYMQKFIDFHYLVHKSTPWVDDRKTEASDIVKQMVLGRESIWKNIENYETENNNFQWEIDMLCDTAEEFFKKLHSKDIKGVISHEWEEGMSSFHDWYCRLCKVLAVLD